MKVTTVDSWHVNHETSFSCLVRIEFRSIGEMLMNNEWIDVSWTCKVHYNLILYKTTQYNGIIFQILTKYVMYQKLTSNSVQTIITKIGFQSLLFNFISKLWAKFCINLWEENVLVPRKLLHNNITTLYALFNVKKMRSIFYLLNGKNDIAIHRKIVWVCFFFC